MRLSHEFPGFFPNPMNSQSKSHWIPMKIHGFPMGRPRRKTCVAVASCAFRRFASCNCCCCSAEDRNSASWSSRHGQRALQKAGKAMGKCGRNIGKSRENIGKWGKHEKIRGKHGNMWENSENIQEKMEKSWNIRKKHGSSRENLRKVAGDGNNLLVEKHGNIMHMYGKTMKQTIHHTFKGYV